MIIGKSETGNSITIPELLAVVKAAAKIPTCVQYNGVLQGKAGTVQCELHFYGLSTLGWYMRPIEDGATSRVLSKRYKSFKQIEDELEETIAYCAGCQPTAV